MQQLALFNTEAPQEPPAQAATGAHPHRAELENLAFLYTAAMAGGSSGIKFMATLEDAQKWCSSPTSRGQLGGSPWAYFYTTVWNFAHYHNDFTGTYRTDTELEISLDKLHDNGEWDERIAATGCKKIALDEIAAILEPLGVKVTGTPRVTRKK